MRKAKGRGSALLLGSVFVIEFVHHPDVDGNEDNEDVDATLLCEPESQLKSPNADVVELLNKEDAAAV